MNLERLFAQWWGRLVTLFSTKKPTTDAPALPQFSNAQVKALVMGLANTDAQELSCDEVYALLDRFAEMELQGEDAAALMPWVEHHLNMCPECREEYDALRKSMQATAHS